MSKIFSPTKPTITGNYLEKKERLERLLKGEPYPSILSRIKTALTNRNKLKTYEVTNAKS